MSAPRTRSEATHDEQPSKPQEQANELPAWIDMLHSRIDALVLESAEHRRMFEPVLLPLMRLQTEDNPTHTHIQRRRSLDEMEAAMRRLLSPEPRPRDDESAQVLHDAITELILQRQLVADLMQAATNSYQHGLAAVRKMTER